MEFKNSVSILFSNIGYVFKLMAWLIISLLIAAGIGAGILIPIWRVLASTTDVSTHISAIKESFSLVWQGGMNMRVAANDIVPHVILGFKAANQNPGALAGLIFAGIFAYAVFCFLRGLSFYSLSDIINKLMASNMRFGFASNMALNLRKNAIFSLARLSISLPIDVAYALISISVTLVFYQHIGLFAVPLLLIFSVVFFSLRAILFSGWLPRMLYHPEEMAYAAFFRSLVYVKHNFTDLFKAYAIIFTLVYLIVYICTMPTGGLTIIVIVPMHYFLLRSVELISYFKAKGMSFYTDGSTVVNTVDYGFRPDNQEMPEEKHFEAVREDAKAQEGDDADASDTTGEAND